MLLKIILSIGFFLMYVLPVGAQFTSASLEQVRMIKEGKIIFALESNEQTNDNIKSAVRNIWDFNSDYEFLPKKEAKKKAKDNDGVYVILIGSYEDKSLSRVARTEHSSKTETSQNVTSTTRTTTVYLTRDYSTGFYLAIGKGGLKTIVKQWIPVGENGDLPETYITFGLSGLQSMFKAQDENNLNGVRDLVGFYKENSKDVKNYKLYIPNQFKSSKLSLELATQTYPYPLEFTSNDKWGKAILEKEEKIAYLMTVPYPMNGTYFYQHYLVNAKNGRVFYAFNHGLKVEVDKKALKKFEKVANGDL